ncbi:secreted RxLR effector protein 161-like [Schistocerca piceifrons]|uniref:secreted RxLR effector protein 161-like n=1 Tax=Schistocerca piceifrons TaxID=274613 RepID=UPI001F5E6F93|nr:secreted RxLR effector protein 161-like [Schistocerca piceifrons]
MNQFKMRDLGELSWCLGMRIKCNRKHGTISIDQSKYAANLLQKCETKLTDEENLVLHRIPYQQAIVSLLYLDQSTRLDIAYAVGVLSRFNSNYRKIHWEAVKQIMRYIKGTVNVGIAFRKSGTTETEGFCDADYASDLHQRLSTTGYIFKLAGPAVSWTSKRQQTVALSTTEAEYMALSAAAQELVYLQGLLRELCVSHSEKPGKFSVNLVHELTSRELVGVLETINFTL